MDTFQIESEINLGNQSSPLKLAYDESIKQIFALDFDNGDLFAINPNSNSVVSTLHTGALESSGIAYDSSNNALYVTSALNHTIMRIDPANRSITQFASVSGRPGDIIYVPSNHKLYAAIGDSAQVVVLDDTSGSTTSMIPLPCPTGIAYDTLQNTLYITDSCAGSVVVVNASSNAIVGNISVGSDPVGIAFDPRDDTMFVANVESSSVSVINCSSMSVIWTISTGNSTSPIQVAYDSKYDAVFISNQATDVITVASALNYSIIANIRVPGSPYGILYDQDNGKIYAIGGSSISVIISA
ncbi:MAG: YncE family protein [Nitrososphaerales archaeon]